MHAVGRDQRLVGTDRAGFAQRVDHRLERVEAVERNRRADDLDRHQQRRRLAEQLEPFLVGFVVALFGRLAFQVGPVEFDVEFAEVVDVEPGFGDRLIAGPRAERVGERGDRLFHRHAGKLEFETDAAVFAGVVAGRRRQRKTVAGGCVHGDDTGSKIYRMGRAPGEVNVAARRAARGR